LLADLVAGPNAEPDVCSPNLSLAPGIMTSSATQLLMQRMPGEVLILSLSGDWVVRQAPQSVQDVEQEISRGGPPGTLRFDTAKLGHWDSALVAFVMNCLELCERLHIEFVGDALPPGVRRLIQLARAVPEKREAKRDSSQAPLLSRLGQSVLDSWASAAQGITFLGELLLATAQLLRGKAQFRWPDAFVVMQECGPEALGVVALINFLVGLILAFVGAVQLSQFGASIYVADLVAIATVREMGCLMTAIIICGRTGAAFAAQLGTMKVNEEIDAFRTFGISPMEFLVLPRILALLVVMPLLCVFADLIAIAGGYVVSVAMLDVTRAEYIDRTIQAITLHSFFLGVFKAAWFGVLVAMTGCWRGLRSGDSAAAVGLATTSAVVTGITTIIAADGVFAVLCHALGI
jgi:phospholipid/cholesterol/gamma-HCH transport system permease protein